MMNKGEHVYHTVEEEWLSAYSAGGLSFAKHFVLNCQAAINPKLSPRLETMDTIGGVLLESANGETLSDGFMSRVFDKIENLDVKPIEEIATSQAQDTPNLYERWMPAPLANFLNNEHQPLKWKNMGFGVARMPLFQQGKEKLYLLKARPGIKMPLHTHHGQEWTLILHGGYHVGNEEYIRGDLHREDESCTHRPLVDDHGEECITLVASEGGVKFTNPVMNLLKPVLGV